MKAQISNFKRRGGFERCGARKFSGAIHHANSTKAFTLLEILVALVLFGLVASAIYSSWFAIMKGSRVGLTAAAKIQRARVAMQTIEEALSSARSFDADNQYYWFVGENGAQATLSFVAKLPESFPRSGKFGDFDVRRVTFALEPASGTGSGKQLVLRQNPILMRLEDFKDEMEHPIVIAKDVKTFALEFWDERPPRGQMANNPAGTSSASGTGSTLEWLDEWDETNRLPAMVKVTMQFVGDDVGQNQRESIKVVKLPTKAVPAMWQRAGGVPPGGPGAPGLPGGGAVPGLPPPNGNGGAIRRQ